MPIAKPTKRITIKPFIKPPKLPPDFYDTTSKELLLAISAILRRQEQPPGLQHSYNSVVNLVSHQFGPRLYQDLVKEFQESAKLVLPAEREGSELLPFLAQQYPKYVDYLLLVRHIFLDLDRPYVWEDGVAVKRTSQSTTILEVGLKQFHQRLVDLGWDRTSYEEWWQLLWESFSSQSTSLILLESTMNLWKDLGIARAKIQQTQPRLQTSLQQLSVNWQSKQPYYAEAFLLHAHQQWQYVSTHWTFLPKTWLRTLVEIHLLEPHLNGDYLLKSLDITHLDHCQRLWYLAARIEGGLPRVLAAVSSLAKQKGLQCLQQVQPTPKAVISGLLELHSQLRLLQDTVGDIPLKPVWTEIMNQSSLVAEWLAKFVDLEFKNFKSETSLEPLLYLFTYLQAKDVFEAFYKKDLAKRLLWNRIQSVDIERQFVSLLKTECGAGYTSKMEGMFQDMEWSRESLARYKSSPEFVSTSVEMEVQILTTGYWPVYPQYENLVLPPELTEPQEHFWNHYKTKYQGRKIVWQYALGNCTVKFTGGNKTYEFVVSLVQTLVLMCFNEKQQWTIPELMRRTGMEDREEMERTLMSMALGKEQYRILVKKRAVAAGSASPKQKPGASISDDDVFGVNEKFTSNMRRIRIPNVLKKETKEEREKVVEGVSRDRLYLIDAVLVRIMKARKTITHQELIPQVLEQVKVPAQPSDVKKRIESLIEREYMERDEKDRNRYNYLA
jgi:cullin-4